MIALDNIEVTYRLGTDKELCALRIPSLTIAAGSWCNLIGPNGSGKTTLIRVLSRDIAVCHGSVLIDGRNVTKWKPNQLSHTVQVLEQNPETNTIASMTVEENLRLYSQNGRAPLLSFLAKGSSDRIRQLLARFEMGLETRLSSQVGLLSAGQKQAVVALAAVLLRAPKVLLLDEFLASIDPQASPKLLSVVRGAASAQAVTVVMVSHDLTHVENLGDRLIFLSNGQVADDVSTAERPLSRAEIIARYSAILKKHGTL